MRKSYCQYQQQDQIQTQVVLTTLRFLASGLTLQIQIHNICKIVTQKVILLFRHSFDKVRHYSCNYSQDNKNRCRIQYKNVQKLLIDKVKIKLLKIVRNLQGKLLCNKIQFIYKLKEYLNQSILAEKYDSKYSYNDIRQSQKAKNQIYVKDRRPIYPKNFLINLNILQQQQQYLRPKFGNNRIRTSSSKKISVNQQQSNNKMHKNKNTVFKKQRRIMTQISTQPKQKGEDIYLQEDQNKQKKIIQAVTKQLQSLKLRFKELCQTFYAFEQQVEQAKIIQKLNKK